MVEIKLINDFIQVCVFIISECYIASFERIVDLIHWIKGRLRTEPKIRSVSSNRTHHERHNFNSTGGQMKAAKR
jgi:hypothetical protein